MSQRATSRVKKRQQYVRNACNQCKRRKVKCSGEPHCQQCAKHRVLCTYDRVAASPQDLSSQVLSSHEGLEGRLLQLQSSVDQVLSHLKRGSPDPRDRDMEVESLDTMLLRTKQEIDVCRAALASRKTVPSPPDDPQDFHLSNWDLLTPSPSFTTDDLLMPNQIASECPTLPLSKTQTLELIEYFRFEAECFYPFISFDCLTSLVATVFDSTCDTPDLITTTATKDWGNRHDSRNLDMLRLLLACSIASKMKRETETSHQMMSMASRQLTIRLDGPKFDVKDIAIATLLSIYYLQCDEIVFAWRKISLAAKMCQELELHKSTDGQPPWVLRMFWCIYVLDKRFSFMINCPFTLHDADIGHMISEHDESLEYISSIAKYLRLAAQFVLSLPKLGSNYALMEPSTCASLETQTEQWALSTSITRMFAHGRDFSKYERVHRDQFKMALVTVCRNQMKMGLYKHNLFSSDSIAQNPDFSRKTVSIASETIQSCNNLQKTTPMYELQAVHFNFFVLSAVAALYLAVRHAPLQFSESSKDIFTGIGILRPYCTLDRLCERVWTLENAMKRLGHDPMGIGPQLILNETPTSQETSCIVENGWSEVGDEQLVAWMPSLGLLSSITSPSRAEAPHNDVGWIESPTHSQQQWDAWDNQEWIL